MKELPKGPLDLKKILAEGDPVKKAYLLGYFIAYYGHTDWVGVWRELRDSVLESAEESGVLRKAIDAYRRGKKDGAHDRELAIAQGLYRPLSPEEVEHEVKKIQEIKVLPPQTRIPKMLRVRLTGEPRMLLRSQIMDQVRTLSLPRFLGRR